jgi:hypothetical protein
MLTYADVCRRMLTYADVCRRMLTYADVCPTNVALRLTDKGVDLRMRGHVHGGVEMAVRATTPPAGSLQLRSTYWHVEGEATPSSLQALQVRTHAEARSICAHSSCHDEVRIYQHTSAYVAYVSIRQHMRVQQLPRRGAAGGRVLHVWRRGAPFWLC